MMKHLTLFLLIAFVTACTTDPIVNSDPNRLPEPTGRSVTVDQWNEYCDRQEWKDPACEEK
jgi:hypothetical protein